MNDKVATVSQAADFSGCCRFHKLVSRNVDVSACGRVGYIIIKLIFTVVSHLERERRKENDSLPLIATVPILVRHVILIRILLV
jgi:hypothetical protein